MNSLGENWRWLGKIASVPESTISRWRDQCKYPSVEKVIKMAEAVGCSVEFLVTGKDSNYAGLSELSLKIAAASENLNETGQIEALHLIQSLAQLHPASPEKKGQAGIPADQTEEAAAG